MSSQAMRVWTLGTVIVMIVIIALGWFLGIAPKLAEAAVANSERVAVEAQNTLIEVAIQELEQTQSRLTELRQELDDLADGFPPSAEYANAIQQYLASLASTGVVLDNLAIQEPTIADSELLIEEGQQVPTGTLLAIPVQLSVFGDLAAVLSYADALQQSSRFVVISSMTYTGSVEVESRALSISMTMYVITGEPRTVSAPAPAPEPEPEPTETADPDEPASEVNPTPTPAP